MRTLRSDMVRYGGVFFSVISIRDMLDRGEGLALVVLDDFAVWCGIQEEAIG